MKAFKSHQEMERVFDEGKESILDYADMSTLNKPDRERPRRVALDMGDGTIARLDAFAARYGVTRQSLIKVWLVERMDEEDDRAARRRGVTA